VWADDEVKLVHANGVGDVDIHTPVGPTLAWFSDKFNIAFVILIIPLGLAIALKYWPIRSPVTDKGSDEYKVKKDSPVT